MHVHMHPNALLYYISFAFQNLSCFNVRSEILKHPNGVHICLMDVNLSAKICCNIALVGMAPRKQLELKEKKNKLKSYFIGFVPYHGIRALWRLPLSGNRAYVIHVKSEWIRFGEAKWDLGGSQVKFPIQYTRASIKKWLLLKYYLRIEPLMAKAHSIVFLCSYLIAYIEWQQYITNMYSFNCKHLAFVSTR